MECPEEGCGFSHFFGRRTRSGKYGAVSALRSECPFRADRILASCVVVMQALWAESRLRARFRISELFRRVCTSVHGRRVRTRSSVQHCNACESSMNFAHHLVTISDQPQFTGSDSVHTSHGINFLFNTVGSNWSANPVREPMQRRPDSPICLLCTCRSGTQCSHVNTADIHSLLSNTCKMMQ